MAEEPHLLHFLLVEDDDDHAEIVLRTIKRNRVGNTVARVSDGVSALEYLRKQGEFTNAMRPDVVLLDLKLPRLDGHEVLAEIKHDNDLKAIPVVVLTTSNVERDRLKAYENYANSFVVKPINFTRFRQLVSDLSLYWGVWSRPSGGH